MTEKTLLDTTKIYVSWPLLLIILGIAVVATRTMLEVEKMSIVVAQFQDFKTEMAILKTEYSALKTDYSSLALRVTKLEQ